VEKQLLVFLDPQKGELTQPDTMHAREKLSLLIFDIRAMKSAIKISRSEAKSFSANNEKRARRRIEEGKSGSSLRIDLTRKKNRFFSLTLRRCLFSRQLI
jgi:hypothetical protein